MKYTAIGFWYNDEPVVAGVVPGEHPVYCGTVTDLGDSSFQGEWAVSVEANSASGAKEKAVAEMLAGLLGSNGEGEGNGNDS
jgi:hypothetical protein